MRSLDEFYKYIEKQERALRDQDVRKSPEPSKREPEPRRAATPVPPVVETPSLSAAEASALIGETDAAPVVEQREPALEPPPPVEIRAEGDSGDARSASAEGFVPPPLPPRTPRPSRYESILPPDALRPVPPRDGQNAPASPRNGSHRPPAVSDIRHLMRGGAAPDVKPKTGARETTFDTGEVPDIEAYIPMLRDPQPDAPAVEVAEAEASLADGDDLDMTETPLAVSVIPVSNEEAAALWGRLPHHIQVLFRIPEGGEEVAQKYYTRGFKESRRALIERLLNPTLTLEEAARVLGVCPTTVRRYTNRGVLPHHRTTGQQRRFRLSDVLGFLERSASGRAGSSAEDDGDQNNEDAAP